jgi:hypothetical protein
LPGLLERRWVVAVVHPTHGTEPDRMGGGPGWHFSEWLFGILGGIGVFLGLFTFLASDQSSIGIGGDWTWEVGEISTAAKVVLLVAGGLLVLLAIVMAVLGRHRARPVARMDGELSNLVWHAGVFVVVNAFIWIQDVALGGGLDYAYWVTIPWGLGLAAHAVTYARDRRKTTPA